jgi:hypothetical protein
MSGDGVTPVRPLATKILNSSNRLKNFASIRSTFSAKTERPRSVILKKARRVLINNFACARYVFAQWTRLLKTGCFPLGNSSSRSASVRFNWVASVSTTSDMRCSPPSLASFRTGNIND